MAKALKCDKCGGFFDYYKIFPKWRVVDTTSKCTSYNPLDLCPGCYEDLLELLNIKEETDATQSES